MQTVNARRWPTLIDLLRADVAEVLRCLPCEPNGLSLHELAADLLGGRDPASLARMADLLAGVGELLGGLAVNRGAEIPIDGDGIDRPDAELYGLPRDTFRVIQRIASGGRKV